MTDPRKFPLPWRAEQINDECVCVVDANGLRLSYHYFSPQPRARLMDRLEEAEAWRVARWIARAANEEGSAEP